MSILTKKDLHTPFNNLTIQKIMGHILAKKSEQLAAAALATSLMTGGVITQRQVVQDLYALFGVAFGAGESLTIDVLVNGATILNATLVLDSTQTPDTQIPFVLSAAFIAAGKVLNPGDRVQVTRTYTAGGAPTAPVNTVVLEAS